MNLGISSDGNMEPCLPLARTGTSVDKLMVDTLHNSTGIAHRYKANTGVVVCAGVVQPASTAAASRTSLECFQYWGGPTWSS